MKTTLDYLIMRLIRRYGTFSSAARRIGIDPRSFRTIRRNKNKTTGYKLAQVAGKWVTLCELLHELRKEGCVTDNQIKTAWGKIRPSSNTIATEKQSTSSVANKGRKHDA